MAEISSAPEPEVSPVIVAGSSTAEMVNEIAWVVVPLQSSVMVTMKESLPLKLAVGV